MVTRHTLCFSHRVSDYDHALCCAVCMLWPEEVIQLYAWYRMSASETRSESSAPPLPPCSILNPLRTVWLLMAPSDPSTRNRHLPVTIVDLAAFIPWQLVALQACVFSAFPSAGYQSGSARVGCPWPPTWPNCWLRPHIPGFGWSGLVSCGPFCRPLVC